MRRLAVVLLVGLIFSAAVVATLPADRIARRLLAQAPLPGGGRLDFADATLGWGGVTLHDATWHGSSGDALVGAERLRLRPSLRGWVRDRSGRPWTIEAALCGGSLRAVIEETPRGNEMRAAWAEMDLAPCLHGLLDDAPTGVTTGSAIMEVEASGPLARGTLQLRDAAWRPGGLPRHLPLDARHAVLDWRLEDDRLRVDRLELANQELEATLTGTVELAAPPSTSRLDLLLHVVPLEDMPQGHRDLFRSLAGSRPDRRGGRRFRLTGTLGSPYLIAP